MFLGGRLWVESEDGVGSAFYTEIPMAYEGEAPHLDGVTVAPVPDFHRAPVMILEDNPETAAVFESYLRHSEFQPIILGDVALAEVWVARHTPVAVVADIYMGEDPIWGFIASLRDKLPSVPIVLTSAHDEYHRAMATGASVFLQKPVARDVLLRELRQLTGHTGLRKLLIVD